jgi:hypothetical protein
MQRAGGPPVGARVERGPWIARLGLHEEGVACAMHSSASVA